MLKSNRILSSLVFACCIAGAPAHGEEIEGVLFADYLQAMDTSLRLHGTGLLRYRIFIKGYVAAFYLDRSFSGKATQQNILGDVARRLEIEYFWSIKAEQFVKATMEGITRNTDTAGFEAIRKRIDRLNSLYQDVSPGDRYAITYLPAVGTELSRNGKPLGVIEGVDFARAFFSIWIGESPLNESLKEQLLKGR